MRIFLVAASNSSGQTKVVQGSLLTVCRVVGAVLFMACGRVVSGNPGCWCWAWHGAMQAGNGKVLATGTEALFADMGHFSRPAIQLSTLCVVYPALLITYMGQVSVLTPRTSACCQPICSAKPQHREMGCVSNMQQYE